MPFYIKPVVWNSEGYRKPSGAKFTSGYPHEHGFGHEDWNNAEQFSFSEGADRFKVFHTEGLGNQDTDEQAGLIAIVMIASHASRQWLIGVAAGCTSLLRDEDKPIRLKLADRLGLDSESMAAEAWSLPSVQRRFSSEGEFKRLWRRDFHWIPNWTCPADLYLPLHQPVPLDPTALTGKNKLVNMYGAYQPVDRTVFLRVLGQIPPGINDAAVRRLADWAGGEVEIASDIEAIQTRSATMRAALVQARIGQGAFREQVMGEWQNRCAVTGCAIHEILRASHIQPWRASTNEQRLDPYNGLMLAAHLDALFDRGLISFTDAGAMIVSSSVASSDRDAVWGLGEPLRHQPPRQTAPYLAHHRQHVFRP